MEVVTSYLLQNWALILILIAFAIMLKITVFLSKKTVIRMYSLIIGIFLFSIIVFVEFYLADLNQYNLIREIMMAIRYSATPLLIAFILFTQIKKGRWYVLIPAFILMVINIVSIFTGIVFSLDDAGNLKRGVLGYLPYIGVGLYSFVLIFILIKNSNKQVTEIIPIAFLAFAFLSGLIFPFIFRKDYAKIFCTTIAIALFVYYVFLILQLTKNDALTGLLNRQAYYASVKHNPKDVTAFVSIDMNGLKAINDSQGHIAGDEALITLSRCFKMATQAKQLVYRIGGDEFVIICHKTSKEELEKLIGSIKESVAKTEYKCAIGYCYSPDKEKTINEMIRISDKMMYQDKAEYYSTTK